MKMRLSACTLLLMICGCATQKYRSAPLLPSALATGLEARSLDDAGLHNWMKQAAGFQPTSWPLATWDLRSLALAAYYFSPDLDLARAHAAAAAAAVQTAAMKPNPSVAIGPGYETTPGAPFMFGFDFSLPIETAGKRGYRMAEARRLSEASRIQIAETAWAVRSRVRSALINYLFAEQTAAALQTQEAQQSQYLDLLDARFHAGEVPLPEVTTARIDLTNLRQSLRAAEGQIDVTRANLASVISVPESAVVDKSIEWPQASEPPSPLSLPAAGIRASAIENRLDVQRDLANYEATQSALQLEVARQYPDINLGPGYALQEGAHEISLQLGAILPLRNRNQGPIAQAEAARKVAGAQLLSTQSAVLAEIDKALAKYNAAWSVLEQARQSVAQSADQSRIASDWLKAGESDSLTALSAKLQLSVAQRARINALQQAQLALGALEDALQRPISPATEPPLPKSSPR